MVSLLTRASFLAGRALERIGGQVARCFRKIELNPSTGSACSRYVNMRAGRRAGGVLVFHLARGDGDGDAGWRVIDNALPPPRQSR